MYREHSGSEKGKNRIESEIGRTQQNLVKINVLRSGTHLDRFKMKN